VQWGGCECTPEGEEHRGRIDGRAGHNQHPRPEGEGGEGEPPGRRLDWGHFVMEEKLKIGRNN